MRRAIPPALKPAADNCDRETTPCCAAAFQATRRSGVSIFVRIADTSRHAPRFSPRGETGLLEFEVLQGGPAGVGGGLVFVVGGLGVVEGLAANRAEAGAVGAAEEAGGEGEDGGVVGPAADVEL